MFALEAYGLDLEFIGTRLEVVETELPAPIRADVQQGISAAQPHRGSRDPCPCPVLNSTTSVPRFWHLV
jgi:hypothetical protein